MELQLTAVFRSVREGYIGFVEELPGANTQAETLEEALESLREAVKLVLKTNPLSQAFDATYEIAYAQSHDYFKR